MDNTSVAKYQLTYKGGCGEFTDCQPVLFACADATRAILNESVGQCHEWTLTSKRYKDETGVYPDYKEVHGCTIGTAIYQAMRERYPMLASSSCSALVRMAQSRHKQCVKDVLAGRATLPTYRTHPIVLHPAMVKFAPDGDLTHIRLTLTSSAYRKEHGLDSPIFSVSAKDKRMKHIWDSLVDGSYKLSNSQLAYEGKRWWLYVTYIHTVTPAVLDVNKALGVDMGEVYAITACGADGTDPLIIQGGEVTAFARQHEKRIREMQKQATVCGGGRVGHGTKTRVKPIYRSREAVSNFRKTTNHRYSKALVDYAVKHGFGTIKLEDLSGIKANSPRLLHHWTYYDLQSKIKYKAKRAGIEVITVNPAYTSQKCSVCGHTSSDNRKTQAEFVCQCCGHKENADVNAARNIANL